MELMSELSTTGSTHRDMYVSPWIYCKARQLGVSEQLSCVRESHTASDIHVRRQQVKQAILGRRALTHLSILARHHVGGRGRDLRVCITDIYDECYTLSLYPQMTLGGMVFGYVICSVQSSNSVATASSDGLRKLRVVTIPFSLLILLVGCYT